MLRRKIRLAYSPDTDDAFMVNALRRRLVDPGPFDFEFATADIQTLNEAALQGVYDVTAISVAAFPAIQDEYQLMTVGASVGDAFGPALVVREESSIQSIAELAGRRVAVPGLRTSAFFAARAVLPSFEAVPMGFLEVMPAVARGEADAGIVIHELGLDCERRGFRKLADLGCVWNEQTGLPLPLGVNAIKRDLGRDVIAKVTEILRRSIEVGLASRDETLLEAMRESGADIDRETGDRYISMYVNGRSLRLEDDVRAGIERLIAAGHAAGLCEALRIETAIAEA